MDKPIENRITLEQRKDIFLALVNAQDEMKSVPESRNFIGQKFGLNDAEIRQIEREGLDNQWPPLAEAS